MGGTGLEPVTPSLSSGFSDGDDLSLSPTFPAQPLFRDPHSTYFDDLPARRLCVYCASARQSFCRLIGQRVVLVVMGAAGSAWSNVARATQNRVSSLERRRRRPFEAPGHAPRRWLQSCLRAPLAGEVTSG